MTRTKLILAGLIAGAMAFGTACKSDKAAERTEPTESTMGTTTDESGTTHQGGTTPGSTNPGGTGGAGDMDSDIGPQDTTGDDLGGSGISPDDNLGGSGTLNPENQGTGGTGDTGLEGDIPQDSGNDDVVPQQ
jgi:hypothetical protein